MAMSDDAATVTIEQMRAEIERLHGELVRVQAYAEQERDTARAWAARWKGIAKWNRKQLRGVLDLSHRRTIALYEQYIKDQASLRAARCPGCGMTHAPIDLGTCPRCHRPLDNLRGISVVDGGQSVCTACLAPGEEEIARARSLVATARRAGGEGV